MPKIFIMARQLFITAFFISIFIVQVNGVDASSEFLLKSTADTKLGKLKECIKSHDNDVSICITEFKEYLKAEIKLIKSAKDKSIYNQRLKKMINYLRQSADIFYEKAERTKKLEYYEKASRCAALLMKLSKKYQSYEKMVKQFDNAKQGSNSTVLLEIFFRKVKEKKYPTDAFQEAFNSLVKKSVPIYSHLDNDLQREIRAYSNELVLEYMKNLRKIVASLEASDVPDFDNINDQFIIYKEAIKIPGVDRHQTESSILRKKFGSLLGTYLNEAKAAQDRASKFFLDGNNKLSESTDRLNNLKEIICVSSGYLKNKDDLFLEVPSISDVFLNTLGDTTDFLTISIQASNEEKAGEYIKSVKLWKKALSLHSIDKRLEEKAQKLESKAIQAAVDQSINLAPEQANKKEFSQALELLDGLKASVALKDKQEKIISDLRERIDKEAEEDRQRRIAEAAERAMKEAQELASQNKFQEALETLETLRASQTLNKAQDKRILSLKQKIKIQGQKEILKLAETLKNQGNDMAALKTIDVAKIVGMNNELEEFYDSLKTNFNWGEIETLEDAKYFVNCSFDDLLNFITFPKKAGLNVFCEFTLLFENQIDTDGYYGYLGGRSDSPIYIKIINPSFKGATLIGKQAYCVFRINGTKALVNVLTDSTVNVPNLEAIYLQ